MPDLARAKPMAFIVTADRDRAKAFYRDTLGFPLIGEDDFACVFDLNGTALRLSEVAGFRPQMHTVLGWEVGDIAATAAALKAAGVSFSFYDGMEQDALGVWTPPGSTTRVAWFKDPDGNVLSLTQFA